MSVVFVRVGEASQEAFGAVVGRQGNRQLKARGWNTRLTKECGICGSDFNEKDKQTQLSQGFYFRSSRPYRTRRHVPLTSGRSPAIK